MLVGLLLEQVRARFVLMAKRRAKRTVKQQPQHLEEEPVIKNQSQSFSDCEGEILIVFTRHCISVLFSWGFISFQYNNHKHF